MNAVGREALQAVFGDYPWGICPFSAVQDHLLAVRSVSKLPEHAKSIFVVLFPYLLEEQVYADSRLSRYAVSADYHCLCGERLREIGNRLQTLFPQNRFVAFTDASPVPEVYAAAAAGLGTVGKNGLLLTKEYGSWVFIGEIVTDLDLSARMENVQACMGCNACVRACPTGALQADGLKRELCLSHISQKRKLTHDDMQLMRKHNVLWGCDRCQLVCPQNANAKITFDRSFHDTAKATLAENYEDRAYAWRADAVLRNAALLQTEKE